jgi:hypothetical protein
MSSIEEFAVPTTSGFGVEGIFEVGHEALRTPGVSGSTAET